MRVIDGPVGTRDTAEAPLGGDGSDCKVKVSGELSIENAEELLQLFTEALCHNPELVVDFTEVQTCDTAVLQLICSLRKTTARDGQRFRIAALSPAIEDAAAAIGLSVREWTTESIAKGGPEGSGCDV
jgi:anti-anti-sigma factor